VQNHKLIRVGRNQKIRIHFLEKIVFLPRKIHWYLDVFGLSVFTENIEMKIPNRYIASGPDRRVWVKKSDVRHVEPIYGNRGPPRAHERMDHKDNRSVGESGARGGRLVPETAPQESHDIEINIPPLLNTISTPALVVSNRGAFYPA